MTLFQICNNLSDAQLELERTLRYVEVGEGDTSNRAQCLRQAIGQVKAAQTWLKKAGTTYEKS